MATNPITNYLKYANLQMASESLFGEDATLGVLTPGKTIKGSLSDFDLVNGNNHASKFPTQLATDFATGWEVVEHKSNTATGFSGTLFRYTGLTDESKGLVNGEQVISFRSTEFIDDAVRDNQVTNAMEIKEHGWAFGQIADMKLWVDSLYQNGKIDTARFVYVTGYSLGAHVATAFNLLYPNFAQATYTFNGAGVGEILSGSLVDIINQFEVQRKNESGTAFQFADATINSLYADLRQMFNGTVDYANVTSLMLQAQGRINSQFPQQVEFDGSSLIIQAGITLEVAYIVNAINRVAQVMFEGQRLRGVTDSGGKPAGIPVTQVDAARLDYQMAVLYAQVSTSAGPTIGPTFKNERTPGTYTIADFHEIYGDTFWSAVANSQYHYGVGTPISIEDQPLWRGSVLSDAFVASNLYNGIKLLVNEFGQNDFGDTHSLVLLVDSLSVQNVFAQLDPQLKTETFSSIFKAASILKGQNGEGNGKAEGDVLENILNAMADTLGLNWQQDQRLKGNPNGNTWHETSDKDGYSGRDTFYTKLRAIETSKAYQELKGKVEIVVAPTDSMAAKSDFGALLSLTYLAPFVLKGGSEAATILANANKSLYTDWLYDKNLSKAEREDGIVNFTDQWLTDRTKLLGWITKRNIENLPENQAILVNGISEKWQFKDDASNTVINVNPLNAILAPPQHYIRFGKDNADDTITGGDASDYLYGGGGNDILNGGKGDDHLEGNGNGDVLYGGEGMDTLLGGEGSDILEGEKGNDHLKGGTGEDTLRGGADQDTLWGGDGNDVYEIGADDGFDIIRDTSGNNRIKLNGIYLAGGNLLAKSVDANGYGIYVYQSEDKQFTYQYNKSATSSILTINGKVRIEDFSPENFTEIKLPGALAFAPEPEISLDITGDNLPLLDEEGNKQVDALGDLIKDPDQPGGYYDHLYGDDSNNRIRGLLLTDILYGKGGDDILEGGQGGDVVFGDAGKDQLFADSAVEIEEFIVQSESAERIAEKGDWLTGDLDSDSVIGAATDDALFGGGGKDLLVGGAGNDVLNGDDHYIAVPEWSVGPHNENYFNILYTNASAIYNAPELGDADTIYGGTGDDYILGMRGDDYLFGGTGKDVISGHSGADTIFGGADDDYLTGEFNGFSMGAEPGNDFIDGGDGNDWIQGEEGNDILHGGIGNDSIYGDSANKDSLALAGNDFIDAGRGNDLVLGGGGNDTILGGDGEDTLHGDADFVAAEFSGDDYIEGQGGNDVIGGYGGNDKLFGGTGKDSIWGGNGNDAIDGGDDEDFADGGEGADTISGGLAKDTLIGGAGDDLLFGDEGDDVLLGDNDNDILFGGIGKDVLLGQNGKDTLDGGADNDSLVGGDGDDVLEGMAGADVLWGQADADSLSGGEGDDILIGGKGNDTLYGGTGDDILRGGEGDDLYILYAGDGNDYIDDTQGNNTIRLQNGVTLSDLQVQVPSAGNAYYVVKTNAGHSLYIKDGGASGIAPKFEFDDGTIIGRDQLFSDAPKVPDDMVEQVLFGTEADDHINSSNNVGNYMLIGGSGNDGLWGGEGDDTLNGGIGNDNLYGGGGSNTYLYGIGDGDDTISNAQGDSSHILQFKAGILASDVSYLRHASGDLLITLNDGPGSVTVKNYYKENGSRLSQVVYGDGSLQDMSAIESLALLPITPDGEGNVAGTGYGDIIHGDDAENTIDGGGGNDTLAGGAGTDTYVMKLGMGADEVYESSGELNILELGMGVSFSHLAMTQVENDLHIRIKGTNNSAVLKDYCAAAQPWSVRDANGDEELLEDLIANAGSSHQTSAEFVQEKLDQWVAGTKKSIFLVDLFDSNGNLGDGWTQVAPDKYWHPGKSGESSPSYVTVATANTYNDAPEFLTEYDKYSDKILGYMPVTYTVNVPVGQFSMAGAGNYGGVFYNNALLDYQTLDKDGNATVVATMSTSDGQWVVKRYEYFDASKGDGVSGIGGSSGSPGISSTMPITVTDSRPIYETTWNIELANGGPSDNLIILWGFNAVDAGAGNDFIYGEGWWWDSTDTEYGGYFVNGSEGDDTVIGSSDDDYFVAGQGNDYLWGDHQNDTYYILAQETGRTIIDESSASIKTLTHAPGSDHEYEWSDIFIGKSDAYWDSIDTVEFSEGVSLTDLQFSWGNFNSDMINALGWNYKTLNMSWGPGKEVVIVLPDLTNPEMQVNPAKMLSPDATWGIEFFKFADGTTVTMDELMAIAIAQPGMGPGTHKVGDGGNNNLSGTDENDLIEGMGGNDGLSGNAGNDKLEGGAGNDILFGHGGNDSLIGGNGDDYLSGDGGNDTYYFFKGDGLDQVKDYDKTPGNIDTVVFGSGISPDSTKFIKSPYSLQVIYGDGQDQLRIDWFDEDGRGIERFVFEDGTTWGITDVYERLSLGVATENADVLAGTSSDEIIDGLGGDDEIYGEGGNDLVFGGEGHDYLDAGTGHDIVHGGAGDDIIEDWAGNNLLNGGSGDDYLYTAGGASFFIGGQDTDSLGSGDAHTVVGFNLGDGNDQIWIEDAITISFGGGVTVDSLTLTLTDPGGWNRLYINAGVTDSIYLDSFLGAFDAGNRPAVTLQVIGSNIRTYDFNAVLADFEAAVAQGASADNWSIADSLNAHLLSVSADKAIGGALAYHYALDGDLSALSADQIRAVLAAPDFGAVPQSVKDSEEPDIVFGSDADDELNGTADDDTLSGGAGNDILNGGPGDDTYLFNAGDGIDTLTDTGGVDTILFGEGITSDSLTLGIGSLLVRYGDNQDAIHIEGFDPANAQGTAVIENFRFADGSSLTYEQLLARGFDLSGSGSITGTSVADRITGSDVFDLINGGAGNDWLQGLAGNDWLQGGSGDDTIDGGMGLDTLIGGTGNDTYLIATPGDFIMENPGEGIDQIHSQSSFQLGANIENLTLIGRNAITAVGNELDNVLTGSAANNILIGGGGADTMAGGEGDDIYNVNHAGDIVHEQAGEGIDLVEATVSHTLGAHVEALRLSGLDANGTGNALNNLILGSFAGNILNGLGGHDILQGGAGNDVLSDSQGNNLLDGGFGADTIVGGAASDFLAGGAGNDMITLGAGTNVMAFNRGDGMDTVVGGTDAGNTLSLGKNIKYADLMLQKNGGDLVLYTGFYEKITFKDWYVDASARNIDTLQVVTEGTSDYNPWSLSQINNKKVQQFDFAGLVAEFDHVMAEATFLTTWSVSSSLLEFHFGGSNTAAIGGDLAYQYAKNGNLASLSMTPAHALLADSGFGLIHAEPAIRFGTARPFATIDVKIWKMKLGVSGRQGMRAGLVKYAGPKLPDRLRLPFHALRLDPRLIFPLQPDLVLQLASRSGRHRPPGRPAPHRSAQACRTASARRYCRCRPPVPDAARRGAGSGTAP